MGDPFHRHPLDLFDARDLILDGKLGVITPVAFPQAANRTLALVHDLAVCCAPMLIWTNKCAFGDMASRVSGLHAVTLANVNVRQVYRL